MRLREIQRVFCAVSVFAHFTKHTFVTTNFAELQPNIIHSFNKVNKKMKNLTILNETDFVNKYDFCLAGSRVPVTVKFDLDNMKTIHYYVFIKCLMLYFWALKNLIKSISCIDLNVCMN